MFITCWLIYIIAFYPIILSPDPSYQIKQAMGEQTKYLYYTEQLSPTQTVTNHHPVLHTYLLGGCLKLGRTLVNDNFGLFIYSFIQVLFIASVFAYAISF